MQFEHLIEVNDPACASFPALTREILWAGLLCRAEDACLFLPGLDDCRITARGANTMTRELRFGKVLVRDAVRCHPPEWIRFETAPAPEHAGGSLTISIEETERGMLALHFSYRTD